MAKIDLSIVILNYNTATLLKNCLDSIVNFTKGISYQIIIVDNASHELESVSLLKKIENQKNIKVIRSKKNLGFSGGNDVGIKASSGDFILLLNSDTLITSNVFGKFVKWFKSRKDIGIATAALRNQDNSLQATGGFFPTIGNIFSWMFFLDDIPFLIARPYHLRPSNKAREVDWITGAFFMIRSDVVKQIGVLDPDYFMYVEDMDYCYRAKNAGWRIFYNPTGSIIHLGGASSTKEFPIISELKNLQLFFKKHKPSWQLPIVRGLLKIGCLVRVIVMGILKGTGSAKTYVKAFRQI